MIRKAWDSGATGTDTFNVHELLKQCGAYLVEWSRRDFGNVTSLLREAKIKVDLTEAWGSKIQMQSSSRHMLYQKAKG